MEFVRSHSNKLFYVFDINRPLVIFAIDDNQYAILNDHFFNQDINFSFNAGAFT